MVKPDSSSSSSSSSSSDSEDDLSTTSCSSDSSGSVVVKPVKEVPKEVHQDLPDGIEVKPSGSTGYGVFASKAFAKGDVLFIGRYMLVPRKEYSEIKLVLDNREKAEFTLNTDMHTTAGNKWLALYFFDAFMNHSCDPNCYTPTPTRSLAKQAQYEKVALRDIQPGEEITCDYNLFCADPGKGPIFTWYCGAPIPVRHGIAGRVCSKFQET